MYFYHLEILISDFVSKDRIMSDPSFDIQWKDHQKYLPKSLRTFKILLMLHLSVESLNQVHSNKLLLSACSPFMYSLLKDSTIQAVLLVTETDSVLFSNLIRYIHTGSLVVNSDDIDKLGDIAGALGFNSFTTVEGENTAEVQETVEDNREIDNLDVENGNELVNMNDGMMECELEREKDGDTWKVEYPDHHQQMVPSDMNIIDAETYDNLKKNLVEGMMECELEREKEGDTWKVEYPDHHQQMVPSDMNIIDAETYDNLKKNLVEESLKQEHEGKTLVWTCGICNKKWPENTRDTRRNSRRHMESHLVAKFQCLMCGNILKSKESFYHHRSSSCQQSGGVQVSTRYL